MIPKACIADPELRLFQYTAINEFSWLRCLVAYDKRSTYSSADFLRKAYTFFKRHGFNIECVQTDNGFEFTNRFAQSSRELVTLFEKTAAELGIRHKLIRSYTPRHNGKAERSHREDQRRFYSSHRFCSLADFGTQRAMHQRASNNHPMRHLQYKLAQPFTSLLYRPICLTNVQQAASAFRTIEKQRLHGHSPINNNRRASHVCCLIAGRKQYSLCNFTRISQPTHGLTCAKLSHSSRRVRRGIDAIF